MARVLVGSFSPISVVGHAAELSWIHTALETDHGEREEVTHGGGMMRYTRIRGGEVRLARFGFDAGENMLLALPTEKMIQERTRQLYTQSQADDDGSRNKEWELAEEVNTRLNMRIDL